MSSIPLEGTATEPLALYGGAPSVTHVLQPRRRFGHAERKQLETMLEQSSLFYLRGPQTQLLKERFQEHYPLDFVMPCSSGTAALHIAAQAAGIGPGDEVITSSLTDLGTVIGVLYQQGVPVFADLKPHTYNLDVEDVRRKITPRTRAVIAVHLTGNPCDLASLRALCDEHGLILIEDCAQSWGAQYRGAPIGTLGHIGCWSLNDFKHIGCGDGGIVASSDPHFGPLLQKFGDKCYDRSGGGQMPTTLAPNYRISEPQSAVAAAQMEKMWDWTEKRATMGRLMSQLLQDVPGIWPHSADERDRWTCWFYLFRIDPEVLYCDIHTFSKALQAEGLWSSPGYIGIPIYQYPLFTEHNFFAGRWPIKEMGLTEMDYSQVCCPETEAILNTCIKIDINEVTTSEWVSEAAAAICKVAAHYVR
jgi:perosamine synthetase